jgi:hypothetical protein
MVFTKLSVIGVFKSDDPAFRPWRTLQRKRHIDLAIVCRFACEAVPARRLYCVSSMYIWITVSGENVNGTQPKPV